MKRWRWVGLWLSVCLAGCATVPGVVTDAAGGRPARPWADPAGEVRCGERKAFDAGTPLPMDVLPHVVSALQAVFHALPGPAGPPVVEAGGALLRLPLAVGPWPCAVTLERNAAMRRRRIVVRGARGTATLDFSTEPGTITVGAATWDADPLWSRATRPLATLLGAFLSAVSGGPRHPGLSLDTAEATCTILDALRGSYEEQRKHFIIDRLRAGAHLDGPLGYALAEFLQSHSRLDDEELGRQMECLRQAAADATADDCARLLDSTLDQIGRIRPREPK